MKVATETTSTHKLARLVGEHIHAALIPLKTKRPAGNLGIFVADDEKFSYPVVVPISKSASYI